MTIINAFHPDYMKTYHPNFMADFRTTEANQEERRSKEPRKAIRPPRASVKIPKQIRANMLKVTTFHIYSKAGY